MLAQVVLAVAAVGCGRLDFTSVPTGDGGGDTGDDAPGDRPNVAFITSAAFAGGFGGTSAADIICSGAATNWGLPGTFIALISNGTTTIAKDRIATSTGWVRRDGKPFTTTATDWFTNHVQFSPLDIDERGMKIAASVDAWTGTQTDGGGGLMDCTDFTSAAAGVNGVTGDPRSAYGNFTEGGLFACNTTHRLYCFETGHTANVTPARVAGRIAFMSAAHRTTAGGVAALDAICVSEATAAGLPGEYLAAVATTTQSIATRIPADSRPWIRVDGTQIAGGDTLYTGTMFDSFVNQQANGKFLPAYNFYWTGATSPTAVGTTTCNDWTNITTGTSNIGRATEADAATFWNSGTANCNDGGGIILCLQK